MLCDIKGHILISASPNKQNAAAYLALSIYKHIWGHIEYKKSNQMLGMQCRYANIF
jgi:hypothetical protein